MSDLIFPTLAGSQMGVEREAIESTVIQTESSGRELAISQQSARRYRYRISYDFLRQDSGSNEAAILEGFHAAARGQFGRFLFADPYDDPVTLNGFGNGDGVSTIFRLQRSPGGVQSDALGTWPLYLDNRANQLTYSQDWSNAAWTKSATTQAVAPCLAPDGTATAYAITDTAASAQHYVIHAFTAAAVSYTYSVYAKKGATYDGVQLYNGSGGANFNLLTGATSNVVSCTATMTSVGNGWWRCSITATLTAAAYPFSILLNNGGTYAGGSGVVYLWGAQIEFGAATRYIPTTTATAYELPAYWPSGTAGWEPVLDPIWPGVSIYKDDVLQAPVTSWTPGTSGRVTFGAAPSVGARLSWSGSFYRRVRFASDGLRLTRRHSRIWSGEAELISVI